MEGDVKFSEDIIKELAEDFGMDYKEVEEIIALDIEFIKKQAENPEVVSIYIGKNLGTLNCNFWLQIAEKNLKEKSGVKKFEKIAREVLIPRKEKMEDNLRQDKKKWTKNIYMKKPFLFMLKDQIRHTLGIRYGAMRRPDKIWSEIAEHQNNL